MAGSWCWKGSPTRTIRSSCPNSAASPAPAEPGTWGYSRCASPEQFAERYATLLQTVRSLDLLAGFCYTQFADTYQEANGLLHADRRPKFSLAQISEATCGGSRRADSGFTRHAGLRGLGRAAAARAVARSR